MVGRWTQLAKMGPKVLDPMARDRDRVWEREIELVKAWRVEEVVGVVPVGRVRVVQGGGLVALLEVGRAVVLVLGVGREKLQEGIPHAVGKGSKRGK